MAEEEIQHDSLQLSRVNRSVRVAIEGHFVDLSHEMALDLADDLLTLAREIRCNHA